ncbi:unnamed protein product [Rotaria sp. Silwood2]|nr:unnamed protein product [Rotaria sp. Silwood2]
MTSGMRKIHDHALILRSICPDNILVTDDYLTKIRDLGLAHVLGPYFEHIQIGCKRYMTSEFYDSGIYSKRLDIFTFGLILNEVLTETEH